MKTSSPTVILGLVAAMSLLAVSTALAGNDEQEQRKGDRRIEQPTTITEPGSYVLGRNLSVSDGTTAIVIHADNVTLNLNGYSLTGSGNARGTGVLVEGVRGARVTNGLVTDFGIGVQIVDSNNVKVDGLQIAGQDLGGTPPNVEIGVMLLNSRGVEVSKNVVSRTFLGIFVRGGGSGANTIRDNTLAAGDHGALGICYNPAPGANDGPQGDLVYNNLISRFGKGLQTSTQSRSNIFMDNFIAYSAQAIDERTANSNVFEGNTLTQLVP